MDQVRGRLRLRHYSLRTEQAYASWIRRFILANGKRHPGQMGQIAVEAFLTELATRGQLSAGTQNQALAALYREVLGVELPWMENLVRAKRPRRIPVVLSVEEVALTGDAGGVLPVDGGAAVRQRDAAAGMPALADQERRCGSWRDCGARWQKGQGSAGAAARQPAWRIDAAARTGVAVARC
ncbi:hypothetical protein FE36_18540 [Xanthomonas oryzae pv. oryzicola]|nr:hypothetical protein FE36_18540 [Xanthomonas oryzae pv. oryzicola]